MVRLPVCLVSLHNSMENVKQCPEKSKSNAIIKPAPQHCLNATNSRTSQIQHQRWG